MNVDRKLRNADEDFNLHKKSLSFPSILGFHMTSPKFKLNETIIVSSEFPLTCDVRAP